MTPKVPPKGGRLPRDQKLNRLHDVLGAILPVPQAITKADIQERLLQQGHQLTAKELENALAACVKLGWIRKAKGKFIALRPPPASDWRSAFLLGAHAERIVENALGPTFFAFHFLGVPTNDAYARIRAGEERPVEKPIPLTQKLNWGIVTAIAKEVDRVLKDEGSVPQVIVFRLCAPDLVGYFSMGLRAALGREASLGEIAYCIRESVVRQLSKATEVAPAAERQKIQAAIASWKQASFERLWVCSEYIEAELAHEVLDEAARSLIASGDLPRRRPTRPPE